MRAATLVAAAATGAAALTVALGAAADPITTAVSIGFADYAPARVDVLAGDTVRWRNDSVRNHTVTDDGDAYDSGVVAYGDTFQRRFDSSGAFPYHCHLHPTIRGEVDVHELLLDTPPGPAQPGQPYPLSGRAAVGAGTDVAIQADSGDGYREVARTPVGSDGRFGVRVTPEATARYRAVAGASSSPPVDVLVLNRTLRAQVTRGRHATVVSVTVEPASPGSTVVVQLNLRERFGWWPIAQRRTGGDSRARFTLRLGQTAPMRVALTLPDGMTALATSPTYQVGPARRR
jgi:plastocyanin